jgi:large subunit ribosomal protein L9
MPSTLQVILHTDVKNLGKAGELVKVRPGFARNFLLPRSLAVPASESAVKRVQHEKAVAAARAERAKKDASDLAAKLGSVVIKLTQRAGDDGRLFGSVTTKDLEAALKGLGFAIDRKKLEAGDALRTLGTHEVKAHLHHDVTATFKVDITKA